MSCEDPFPGLSANLPAFPLPLPPFDCNALQCLPAFGSSIVSVVFPSVRPLPPLLVQPIPLPFLWGALLAGGAAVDGGPGVAGEPLRDFSFAPRALLATAFDLAIQYYQR